MKLNLFWVIYYYLIKWTDTLLYHGSNDVGVYDLWMHAIYTLDETLEYLSENI